MDSQINTTINLPTHPPTLLREIQDRIGGVLVRPSAALIWSGVLGGDSPCLLPVAVNRRVANAYLGDTPMAMLVLLGAC